VRALTLARHAQPAGEDTGWFALRGTVGTRQAAQYGTTQSV